MAFIDAHREDLGIEPICRELAIAPSSYHEHAARLADPDRRPARSRRDDEMRAQIQRVHDASFGLYGTRKVWHQLRREGVVIAKCTVERLMAAMGLVGVRRGKKTVTTVSNPKAPCPLDKVNREFRVSRPNALWVVDFTYVHTWAGFVYVAFVIDAYARRIVGWKVRNSATAGFVQVDGYGGYTALAKRRQRITLAFCWSHVRRKFFDLADKSPVATEVLKRIAGLYAIESEVRGSNADHRRAVRNEHARG